jgi:acylphosphatase
MPQKKVRLHAIILGLVQGVGFRMFVFEQADSLQLTGWVRNLLDGTVELVAEGPRPLLDTFIMRIENGPRGAYIEEIKINWLEATGEFPSFEIRRTPFF